jgi:pimeloyl-ACP methyl ester carboxylesterase
MESIDIPISRHTLRSFDGTRIAYYVAGRGRRTMVLAPGLGGHITCWKYVLEGFQGVYRMITWDPRGTYGSERPRQTARMGLEDHVLDFEAIRKEEGLDSFVLAGWSMGVQIALEHTHRFPDSVRALALINGSYGHILDTALGGFPGTGEMLAGALKALRPLNPLLRPIARRVLPHPAMPSLLRALGLLGGVNGHFINVLEAFSGNDWDTYFTLMLRLNEHTTESILGDIRVPTLIAAGTRDLLTPVFVAEAMHRAIPGSELSLIPGGTHYTMMEKPGQLHEILERFLGRVDPDAFR